MYNFTRKGIQNESSITPHVRHIVTSSSRFNCSNTVETSNSQYSRFIIARGCREKIHAYMRCTNLNILPLQQCGILIRWTIYLAHYWSIFLNFQAISFKKYQSLFTNFFMCPGLNSSQTISPYLPKIHIFSINNHDCLLKK